MGDRILVVDDEEHLRAVLVGLLVQAGYEAVSASSAEEALEEVATGGIDLVLTDLRMPGMDGLALLDRLAAAAPDVPAVMLSAYGTVGTAVEAMKRGAKEFLTKPFDRDEVMAVVGRVLEAYARDGDTAAPPPPTKRGREILGASPAMRECRELIARAAKSKHATVLLRGETGVGKEVAARAVHRESGRKGELMVAHCAALPETLLEAELFGYEKGSFTGAVKSKPGIVELADGGTLLLDEIGDVPLHIQVKLLRLIAEKTFMRVGGTTLQRADVRFIAATHRDLDAMVREGKFREDLYYRLNVVEIVVPPLRERPEDIAELARRFCATFADEEKKSCALSPEAVDLLVRHRWPGNVRQLENAIQRLVVFADRPSIGEAEVRRMLERSPQPAPAASHSLPEARKEVERTHVLAAIEASKGNMTRAAKLLELSRRNLYYKLKELGIPLPSRGRAAAS